MIGQKKKVGGAEGEGEGKRKRRKWKRERMQRRRRKKRNGVLRGLIDVEDGSVVVDLPNLSSQHVIILTEL